MNKIFFYFYILYYIMFLNYAILTIILLLLIYVSYNVKDKGIIYFILILLIFITLKKCVETNKKETKENFYNEKTNNK